MSEAIIEHPFFNDYVIAFQSHCLREFGEEDIERLKKIVCTLYPPEFLEMKWEGWQIGMPRPSELCFLKEVVKIWEEQAAVLLKDFFKRVEIGQLYCDYSVVFEKSCEGVESRIGKTSGLLFNLEAAYWTFRIKFNKWIEQNRSAYHCCLACDLDEMFARFDRHLRVAFFPTPGPYDIGSKKRKKLEDRILREYAPTIRRALMREIWG